MIDSLSLIFWFKNSFARQADPANRTAMRHVQERDAYSRHLEPLVSDQPKPAPRPHGIGPLMVLVVAVAAFAAFMIVAARVVTVKGLARRHQPGQRTMS